MWLDSCWADFNPNHISDEVILRDVAAKKLEQLMKGLLETAKLGEKVGDH